MSSTPDATRKPSAAISLAAGAAMVLAAVLIAVMLSHGAGTRSAAAPRPSGTTVAAAAPTAVTATKLPADCVPTPHPPPTQYGFVARVQGGSLTGPSLRVRDMDVSVCGVLTVINAQPGSHCSGVQAALEIPADGVIVDAMTSRLTIIPGHPLDPPVEVHALPTRSPVACGSSAHGLKADLTVNIVGATGLFGLRCKIPFTGTMRSTLTGALLSPPYVGNLKLRGSLHADRVSNNGKYCPGDLPAHIDDLAKLPSGGYRATWPAKISIYQPSS